MKVLLAFCIILFSLVINAQITTTKIAEEKPTESVVASYDSTKNFLGENVRLLIGQDLYLPPMSENLRKYGYMGFIKDYTKSILDGRNTYRSSTPMKSQYEELQGRYFNLVGVFDHPNKNINSAFSSKYFLELTNKENGDKLYFDYSGRFERACPFIVVGFFEKQKEVCAGIEFIIRGRNWRENIFNEDKPLHDIETGEEVFLVPSSLWTVLDITLEEKYYTLSYVIENEQGNKLTLPIYTTSQTRCVYYKKDVQDVMNNHPELWEKIVVGKVVVGMTERMVLLSWGEPEEINRSSSGDQWIYEDQYLFFDGGILTSFSEN